MVFLEDGSQDWKLIVCCHRYVEANNKKCQQSFDCSFCSKLAPAAIAVVADLVLPSGARQAGSGVTMWQKHLFLRLAIYNCDMSTEWHSCPLLALLLSSFLVLSPPPSQCLPGLKRESEVMQEKKNILPLLAKTSTKSLPKLFGKHLFYRQLRQR